MEIYKFRSLTNESEYCRLKQILETKKFRCSIFWELNDPMEGIFSFKEDDIEQIFREKGQYRICSFSGKKGFKNPAIWGYYAGGFKGVAIEVEVKDHDFIKKNKIKDTEDFDGKIVEIDYQNKVIQIDRNKVEKILLNKSKSWEPENEYRFFKKTDNNFEEIIDMTAIYFGNPYGNLVNSKEIKENRISFGIFQLLKEELIKIAKKGKIKCFNVKIENGIVKKINKNLWS